jgi:murein DD-endopeptidase MepM/ murein hydrolase activator NlpD
MHRPGLCLVACLLAPPAMALELGLPIACAPGRDCWIPRYVDLDPGPGFRDWMCGDLGDDGHSGTDFAIPSLAAMRAGVPVLAAAAGRVRNIRDGMEDVSVAVIGQAAVEGRNCGNGVAIEHAEGWETQYCHLRRGSVVVRPGEEVAAGQKLGLVGMSGEASFPHVHLSVRREGQEVDPFRGEGEAPACGLGAAPLWSAEVLPQLAYLPVMLSLAGFATEVPDRFRARDGDYAQSVLPVDAPALLLWFDAFGLRTGDIVHWRVVGPAGLVFERTQAEDSASARNQSFRSLGRRRPAGGWAPGSYTGTVAIERPGAPRQEMTRTVELR